MKALVKNCPGVGHVDIRDVPEPRCASHDVKIEVAYTGICGTDLHVYHDTFRNYPPVILGHEFSGLVVETDAQVTAVKPGDAVTVLPSSSVTCGACEHCRQGFYMFCAIRRGMGHGVNGSFTQFVVVREDQVYPIGDGVSLEQAALAEPFASAVQVVTEICPASVDDVVLISGPGPIGLLCLMLVVAQGGRAIVAGTSQDSLRLELAHDLGAEVVADVQNESLEELVASATDGRGVDIAYECAGAAPSVAACLRSVRNRGRYAQVGIVGREILFDMDTVLFKQLTVFGSVGHSLRTWDRVMRIIRRGTIDLTRIVTHKLPLSRWSEGFDLCESKRGVKVLLSYDE